MPKSGMFGSSTLGDLIAQSLKPTTQADVNAAFGVRPGKPRYTLSRPQPFKPASGNEAHWRKRLANQGQITATKPTISEKVESSIGDILGKVLSENYARHVAKRAMAPINDWTPVGNVTGMEEGAKAAYHGLTRGDLASGALGAGVFALNAIPFGGSVKRQGENALMALMRDETGAIRAWHGSPHDFDRFDMSKIGTGEGAQAYGHGLYFAENRNVAADYRNTLAMPKIDGREMRLNESDAWGALDAAGGDIGAALARADAELATQRAQGAHPLDIEPLSDRIGTLRAWQKHGVPQITNTGRLYEVNISAEPEDFLDWDAPLSEQSIGQSISKALSPEELRVLTATEAKGQDLQHFLTNRARGEYGSGNPIFATDALRQTGIPGIRYLDQGSRGGSSGTRNYVVFDDSLIDILNKF